MPVERDLVADPGLLFVDPGIRDLGQHLAGEVGRVPVLSNMSVGRATMASSQSFSMTHLRMSDSPEPAPPVKSGEPFSTMPMRLPHSAVGRIFEIKFSGNSRLPSDTRGRSGPKRPS